jgi:hypothetical protein
MFLTNSLYTWTRQVADWAWEPEVIVEAAAELARDAVGMISVEGGAALSNVNDGALFNFGAPEALYKASVLAAALVVSAPASEAADEESLTSKVPSSLGADTGASAKPSPLSPPSTEKPIEHTKTANPVRPAQPRAEIPPPPSMSQNAPGKAPDCEPQHGRWVLKGYRTEIAFSFYPADLGRQAMDHLSTEITTAENQEKYEQRKGRGTAMQG